MVPTPTLPKAIIRLSWHVIPVQFETADYCIGTYGTVRYYGDPAAMAAGLSAQQWTPIEAQSSAFVSGPAITLLSFFFPFRSKLVAQFSKKK